MSLQTVMEPELPVPLRTFPGKVFVSYSSHDKRWQEAVVELLRALGHDVWFDREIPANNEDHWPKVAEQLAHVGSLVLLASRSSLSSDEVFWEYLASQGRGYLERHAGDVIPNELTRRTQSCTWAGDAAQLVLVPIAGIDRDDLNTYGGFRTIWREHVPQSAGRLETQATEQAAAWFCARALTPKDATGPQARAEFEPTLEAGTRAWRVAEPGGAQARERAEALVDTLIRAMLVSDGVLAGPGNLDVLWLLDRPLPVPEWSEFCQATTDFLQDPSEEGLRAVVLPAWAQSLVRRVLAEPALHGAPGNRPGTYGVRAPNASTIVAQPVSAVVNRSEAFGAALTFLIGPETVHSWPEDEVIPISRGLLLGLARELIAQAPLPTPAGVEENLPTFLEAILAGHTQGRAVVDLGTSTQDLPGSGAAALLPDIQAALLVLSFCANSYFVSQHRENATPLEDWFKPITLKTAMSRDLRRRIKSLKDKLDYWNTGIDRTVPDTLGGIALRQSLLEAENQFLHHQLSHARVRWFADAFWHSLTHDVREYPTVGELQFQVSLLHDSEEQRELQLWDLASEYRQLGATRNLDLARKAVTQALSLGFASDSPERERLFDQLALTLRHQHQEWMRDQNRPIALAVSSAMDLELEAALARTGDGRYHVAFPVVEVGHTDQGEDEQWGRWRWALGTFAGNATAPASHGAPPDFLRRPLRWDWLRGSGDSATAKEPPEGLLAGPVIIKINGAPMLDDLPERAGQRQAGPGAMLDRAARRAQRAGRSAQDKQVREMLPLAISEYDNMQFLMIDLMTYDQSEQGERTSQNSEPGLPRWLKDQVSNDSRYWLGVGISDDDWNSRMQLFVYATRANTRSSRIGALFPLSPAASKRRSALLAACGISLVEGTLTDLATILDNRNSSNHVKGR